MLEEYHKKLQDLIIKGNKDPETIPNVLQYISKQISLSPQEIKLLDFYKGETNFYQGQYQEALDFYKKASKEYEVGFYYCRAAAFLLANNNRNEEAIKLIKKALNIKPDDYVSLEFAIKMFSKDDTSEEIIPWKEKIEQLTIQEDEELSELLDIEILKEPLETLSNEELLLLDEEDIWLLEEEGFPPRPPTGASSSFSILPLVEDEEELLLEESLSIRE